VLPTIFDNPAVGTHLERTVRAWLGLPVTARLPVPELPEELAARLLRVEEYEESHRDQLGRWEFAFSSSYRVGKLWEPELDRWAARKREELSATTPLVPLWPDCREFAVCLTHDVDMVSRRATPAQAMRSMRTALTARPRPDGLLSVSKQFARAAGRAAYYGISPSPSIDDTLGRSIAIELDLGVSASYYFALHPRSRSAHDCVYRPTDPCTVRGARKTVGDAIRVVRDAGFDIGLHGSYGSATDVVLLGSQKAELEDLIGAPVGTTRQHYLHFEIEHTPAVHERLGIRADSSLGFNRNIGFRAGTSLPFRHFDLRTGRSINVLEIPLIIQETSLLSTDALELDRQLALRTVRSFLDEIARQSGILTILFHPHDLLNADFLAIFRHTIEYGLERGAWFASVSDVDRWWRQREAAILSVADESSRRD
jgi:hypothetical protein